MLSGIAELFAEFEGRDDLVFRLAAGCEAARLTNLAARTERYQSDPLLRKKLSAVSKARYHAQRRAAGKQPRQPAKHGSAAKYRSGCRCCECRAGRAQYMRERYAAQVAEQGKTVRQHRRAA